MSNGNDNKTEHNDNYSSKGNFIWNLICKNGLIKNNNQFCSKSLKHSGDHCSRENNHKSNNNCSKNQCSNYYNQSTIIK